ncbi:hypothetical protein Pint_14100 [Pistacia integerrima]|uniref:Uncharacterized protein n=1 Tax=Pistacia integerrima TaxID=434235 RepID=A0ACC0Y6D8_9ROSI|nr:hypothetical protein Pint_14100 [Pistacia integerrima]
MPQSVKINDEIIEGVIPYGLKNFTLSVSGTKKGVCETCKYAFLDLVLVVLDWKFSSNETCKICGPNAICSTNQSFISCSCAKGFEGKPYLRQRCTELGLNDCVKNCINTEVNYMCSCPSRLKILEGSWADLKEE